MSDVETLRNLPRRQMSINLDCDQDLVVVSDELTTGQHRDSHLRTKARKRWQMSVLIAVYVTYLTLCVGRFCFFSEEKQQNVSKMRFFFNSPFLMNSAHTKHIQTQQSLWQNVKRCLTCQRVCDNPRFGRHAIFFYWTNAIYRKNRRT